MCSDPIIPKPHAGHRLLFYYQKNNNNNKSKTITTEYNLKSTKQNSKLKNATMKMKIIPKE